MFFNRWLLIVCKVQSNKNLRIFTEVRPSEILTSAMLLVANSCNYLFHDEVHIYF